jgi:hypothetical protein
MEMLMLIALGGGVQSGDLVSYLPPEAYFKANLVPVNLDNMIYLATKEPADGEAQIKQLMCLRALAEQPDLFRKSKDKDKAEALTALRKIAGGELANDKQGFAKEYAQRALAVLDGGKLPQRAAAPPLEEGLAWFPVSATFAGVIDSRRRDAAAEPPKEFQTLLGKLVRQRDWEEVFRVADTLGNIRIERVAFALHDKGPGQHLAYMRLTGKADHKRLVKAFKTLSHGQRLEFNESKDAKSTPITLIHTPGSGHAPVIALIGDTDLVVAISEGPRAPDADAKTVLEPVLNVRDGKADGVPKGALKDRLKVDTKSFGVFAGAVPDELRREMFRGGAAAPRAVRVELTQAKDGVDLRVQATMDNAEAATAFTKFIVAGRQQALAHLQNSPNDLKLLPAGVVADLKKAIQSVQVRAEGAVVHGGVHVSTATLLGVPFWILWADGGAAPGSEVPRRPKESIR